MIFLLLAILSSSMISILMRVSSKRVSADLSMLAVNYLICAILGLGYTGFQPATPADTGFGVTMLVSVVSGAFYLVGFVLFPACFALRSKITAVPIPDIEINKENATTSAMNL